MPITKLSSSKWPSTLFVFRGSLNLQIIRSQEREDELSTSSGTLCEVSEPVATLWLTFDLVFVFAHDARWLVYLRQTGAGRLIDSQRNGLSLVQMINQATNLTGDNHKPLPHFTRKPSSRKPEIWQFVSPCASGWTFASLFAVNVEDFGFLRNMQRCKSLYQVCIYTKGRPHDMIEE